MFESGKWKTEEDESESESDDEEQDENDAAWNLEKLREETEAIRAKKEEERLANPAVNGDASEEEEEAEPSGSASDEADTTNGTNGIDEASRKTTAEP